MTDKPIIVEIEQVAMCDLVNHIHNQDTGDNRPLKYPITIEKLEVKPIPEHLQGDPNDMSAWLEPHERPSFEQRLSDCLADIYMEGEK